MSFFGYGEATANAYTIEKILVTATASAASTSDISLSLIHI